MDNYKIKVNDEAESKEAQELFFELGYIAVNHVDNEKGFIVVSKEADSPFNFDYWCSVDKELTLPQLRDLVVLKRNDVKDATHRDKQDESIYLTSDKVIYYWYGEWCESAINKSNDYEDYIANSLTPITQTQDPSLISGADALRALADGKEVEYRYGISWESVTGNQILITAITGDKFEFRIKPQTIKLELEIPAPYKAKIGGRDDTSFVLNIGRHQYCYKNEDDYTKARDALEAVFDSALRGTNS